MHPSAQFKDLLSIAVLRKRNELRVILERGVILGQDIATPRAQFLSLDHAETTIVYPDPSTSRSVAVAALTPQWPAILEPLPEWFFQTVPEVEKAFVVKMSPTAAEDVARASSLEQPTS